jgi:uncharacterized protein (TIGR03435 family)
MERRGRYAFELVAKPPRSAFASDPKGDVNVNLALLRPMVRAFLAERFKLKVHMADKVAPIYALTVGKHGPKLKETAGGDSNCRMQIIEGVRMYVCHNMTMQGLADRLRGVAVAYLDHPVIDMTELKAAYDFTLAWTSANSSGWSWWRANIPCRRWR